ncbi:MAG: hypothetical protein PUB56_01255, partial [Paraprevotella sp.]|nr:hypothetical protein [Paraprevotella sp.]
RILSHHKAIVFIQIKHGVFDCKVHKQKRHVKVGSFRMVTFWGIPHVFSTEPQYSLLCVCVGGFLEKKLSVRVPY